jgi:uncharacterized damage-inducible protein DinB
MSRTVFGRAAFSFVALALMAAVAPAQNQPPAEPPKAAAGQAAETLTAWNGIGRRLIAMAEDFPEDKYDFKPQRDVRTFAEQLLHVAGVNYELLSAVKGSSIGPGTENPSRQTYKTKADVVSLLKKSFADGAALIQGGADTGLAKTVKYPYANRMVTTWFCWLQATEHAGEHYGQLVVYYRVNGMVPPQSRPRQ